MPSEANQEMVNPLLVYQVRCEARAAAPQLGPTCLQLSVTQRRCCLPFFAKKRVIAEFHFGKGSWHKDSTGEWRNTTPYYLVLAKKLWKLHAETPVKMKVWTRQGTTRTMLHLSLRELLHTLDRCPATLTLDLSCSSARLQLYCPVVPLPEDNGKSSVAADAVPLPIDNDKTAIVTDTVPGVTDIAPEKQEPFLESMVETASGGHLVTFSNSISCEPVTPTPAKQDATKATHQPPPSLNTNTDQHLESKPSRSVRFLDSGSVFVEQLREYERDAVTTNTCEDAQPRSQRPPQPRRTLMWCLWGGVQLVPPCLVKSFLLDLHYDTIPRIFGELAFPVQTALWVWTSMTLFTFYASSWMPLGRVLQEDKEKVGKEGPAHWHECLKCGLSVPDIARHCGVCNVCVWERDHHCIVTGTCVGRDNVEAFKVLYILSAMGGLMYLLVVMGGAWMYHVELKPSEWFIGVISVFFLLAFTMIFFQLSKRRRRIKEKYPLFYNDEGELAHLWR